MSVEEEEEDFFIPNQDVELREKLEEELQKERLLIKKNRQKLASLKLQNSVLNDAARGYILSLEKFQAKKQSWWYFILLILSCICVLGQWDKGNKFLFTINVIAHKILWKRMYMETYPASLLIGAIIIIYTFMFG